nr:SAM-dependent methyltransferase [Cryptomonas curvata]
MVNRKTRCDFFYFTAKKFNFRSRAAFKLIEMNKKFFFLDKATGVLDLCAAPGSWMQVVQKLAPLYIPIIGIDIYPIKPLIGCITVKGDITSPSCFSSIFKIKNTLNQKINVILHDGSPKMGSKWVSDVFKQNELVLNAFKLARNFLNYGGWFITKIFKSEHFNNLFFILRNFFKKIFIFKPIASRSGSTEIYLICNRYFCISLNFNSLLEPNFLFKKCEHRKKNQNVRIYATEFDNSKNILSFLKLIKKKTFFFSKKFNFFEKKDENECLFGTDFYGAKFSEKFTNLKNNLSIKLSILKWFEKNL